MENKKDDLVMYVLVPYNLSPIQQGIQAAHAIAELSLNCNILKVGSITVMESTKYTEWVKEHKTIVILNAGTTGKDSTMSKHLKNLDLLDINYATFNEPDLNDALTAIAFIVNKKEDTPIIEYLQSMGLA